MFSAAWIVLILSSSGLYFPTFGLNTEIQKANLRIKSPYSVRKQEITVQKNSEYGHFLHSEVPIAVLTDACTDFSAISTRLIYS